MIHRVSYLIIATVLLLNTSTSWADVQLDRDYRLGDDGVEATVTDGLAVGTNFNSGGNFFTADSENDNNTFADAQDLQAIGAPVYRDVSTRPIISSGFGVEFDGTDDVLSGIRLNVLEDTAGAAGTTANDLPAGFPFTYAGLRARGLQMWVKADAAGLAGGTRQTIVMDTVESGGVAISADGNWTQAFDNETDDEDIPSTVPVAADTWYHVMHHIHPSGAPGAPRLVVGGESGMTGVVYVDGVAVSASNDFPDNGGGTAGSRVGVLSVGAAEVADDDELSETPVFGEFFDGTIDNLEMYVFGDNSSTVGGQDYGTFSLFEDNEWIANEIDTTLGGTLLMGDINRDGVVDVAGDVPALVNGWLSQNLIEGFGGKMSAVGDWNTWAQGDLNLDGVVDLQDWGLLNAANPSVGAAAIAAIRGASVPEPSCLLLLGIGCLLSQTSRRRR